MARARVRELIWLLTATRAVTHIDKGEKKFYGGKKYKPHGKKAGKPDGFIKAKGKNMKGKCFWCRRKAI